MKVLLKYYLPQLALATMLWCFGTCNALAQGEFVNTNLPGYWKTTGNTGTNAAANFIGTTDNVPLVFKVNSQPSGRIDPLFSNTFFGYWAGRDMSTGTQNVAYGTNALMLNIAGVRNTAIGTSSLSNSTGSNNTGIGYATLQNTTTGIDNTAAGMSALMNNTTGYSNTAIGRSAGVINTTGIRNTFIGDSASAGSNNIVNSTAIGYRARVDVSNTIVLGDTVEANRSKIAIGVTEVGGISGITNAKMEIGMQGVNENNLNYRYAGDNYFASYYIRSGGTLRNPTNITGDQIHSFRYKAYDGTQFVDVADISVELDTLLNASSRGGRIVFSTANYSVMKEAMRINRWGNVGIGETDPLVKLHISGGTDVAINNIASGYVKIYSSDTTGGFNHSYMSIDDDEIMSVSQGVGIPLYLQAEGGAVEVHSGTAGVGDDFVLTTLGRVGIGVGNAPGFQLQLATNSAAKPTSTTWTVPSDERLKTNIAPYTGGLKEVLQINPVWYNYNGIAGLPTDERGVGTLAGELEKVAPYMIKPFEYTDTNGVVATYKSVDYNAMLFMFVNAFKEQQKEIEQLEADNKRIIEAISAGR